MTPFDYQLEAINAIFRYFKTSSGNPLVAMPGGTGKSVVIGGFLYKALYQYPNTKALVLTHVKELVAQNYKRIKMIWPNAPAGINSAGIGQRNYHHPIIFAGIGSVAKHPEKFGHVDLILIDEAHLVSDDESAVYRKFIDALTVVNPHLKVIGFTATPWRQGVGMLTDAGIFSDVCIDLTSAECFRRFIAEGYLSPLVPKKMQNFLDVNGVHMQGGDFNLKELNLAVNREDITKACLSEVLQYGLDRKKWLIFCAGIDHSIEVARLLNEVGVSCKAVHSKSKDRDQTLEEFAVGSIRSVSNNNCLTTGFDDTEIDLIVMLRPTTSVILWIQMLSRGTRVCYRGTHNLATLDGRWAAIQEGGKVNCMVLDFARNTARLGAINDPKIPRKKGEKGGSAPIKECPGCNTYIHISARVCEHCGQEFEFKTKLQTESGNEQVMAGEMPNVVEMKVETISYSYHHGRGKPDQMKVTYYCGFQSYSEYIGAEHPEGSYFNNKARSWWRKRGGGTIPRDVHECLAITSKLLPATHIRVWVNKKPYPEIMSHCFDGSFFGKEDADPFNIPIIKSDGQKMQNTDFESKTRYDTDDYDDDIPF